MRTIASYVEKISVVVPVYNSAPFLRRCIESILNQTYSKIELLLIDDGSTDESGQICDAYAKIDERVRVVRQENQGVAAARNRGLDLASGDFVTFVDSDDWIEPVMYERMIRTANENNCDVVMCDCVKDCGEKHEIYSHDIRTGFYGLKQLKEEYYPHLLVMESVEYPPTISNWLILYRIRQLNISLPTSSIRYVEGVRYSEDLLFGAEIILHSTSFYYMKGEVYYHYCFNEKSATNTFVKDKWKDYMILRREAEKRIFSEEFDFTEQMDKMVLFFLFNAAGDILRTRSITTSEKIILIAKMRNAPEVKVMFRRLDVSSLPVSTRIKIMVFLYKTWGIYLLALYQDIIRYFKR